MRTPTSRTPTSPLTPAKPNQRAFFTPPTALTLILVAGDALSFIVFAAAGRGSHGEATGVAAPVQVLWTAAPFALAWFLVAPFLGAYRRGLGGQPLEMLKRAEIAWVVSWPAALVLRWALSSDHNIPVSFAIVILLVNAVLLGGWRTLFAFIVSRMRNTGE